jgi:hypothetical protein
MIALTAAVALYLLVGYGFAHCAETFIYGKGGKSDNWMFVLVLILLWPAVALALLVIALGAFLRSGRRSTPPPPAGPRPWDHPDWNPDD